MAIRGRLRNLAGRPAEWRRFECKRPCLANPVGFRFAGVDGRGRQQLVRDPRNGGVAVVRIEDSQGGSEGYTFDLFWGGDSGPGPGAYPPGPPSGDRTLSRLGDRPSRRFTTEQAVSVCQDLRPPAGRRSLPRAQGGVPEHANR